MYINRGDTISQEDAQEKYLKRINRYKKNSGQFAKKCRTMEAHPTFSKPKLCKAMPVLQYKKDGTFVARYNSATEASQALECSQTAISQCARGNTGTCMGYKWTYE